MSANQYVNLLMEFPDRVVVAVNIVSDVMQSHIVLVLSDNQLFVRCFQKHLL
jgi:hypothetical protein